MLYIFSFPFFFHSPVSVGLLKSKVCMSLFLPLSEKKRALTLKKKKKEMKLNELLFRFALFYLNLFGLTGTFQKTFSGFFLAFVLFPPCKKSTLNIIFLVI